MEISSDEFSNLLQRISSFAQEHLSTSSRIRPENNVLQTASSSLPESLPTSSRSAEETLDVILKDVVPGIYRSTSPAFYGFVTGGTTPAAILADFLVTILDQNPSVHLPRDTISTTLERCAMGMLLDLVQLPRVEFEVGSTLTTGATASNILGLACAREHLLYDDKTGNSVSTLGYIQAAMRAGVTNGIKVITSGAHSSIGKAASIIGLGRDAIIDLPYSPEEPWDIDLEAMETLLSSTTEHTRYIVVIGMAEVNTGRFTRNVKRIIEISHQYGAWVHIDAAFGLFARCINSLETSTVDNMEIDWSKLYNWTHGLELADSITGDGHKLLNVPYDCGIFFTKYPNHLQRVFANTGAAYLASTSTDDIISPLNINLENSRRFRALPVYATLTTYGSSGYRDMIASLVIHARKIGSLIESAPLSDHLELLTKVDDIFMIVLFRAKDEVLNKELGEKINATGKMWVSGTQWLGRPAIRVAVANWRVNDEVVKTVEEVLKSICNV